MKTYGGRSVHRLIPVAALVALFGVNPGCGGDDDGSPRAEPTVTVTVTETVTDEPENDGLAEPPTGESYDSPPEIIAVINDEVVPCEADSPPAPTVVSDRAQTCFYTASDGARDNMSADTFATAAQQSEAIPYLQEVRPGDAIVQGNGWCVVTSLELADQIAEALGGEVVAAPISD